MKDREIMITKIEGSLYQGKGARVSAEDLVLGHTMGFDIIRDTLPQPVAQEWDAIGGEVFLVSGIQGYEMLHGDLKECSILRFFKHMYRNMDAKVELAFDAGGSYMPFYRVWLRPHVSLTQQAG